MIATEINPVGNFDSWDETRLREIKEKKFTTSIGTMLYDNSELTLWQIELKPFERLPFRIHRNNYSCISLTDGLVLSRNINGQIVLIRVQRGKHIFKECAEKEMITDFENVGEELVKITVIEEKLMNVTQTIL